jgi:hypothetical protein
MIDTALPEWRVSERENASKSAINRIAILQTPQNEGAALSAIVAFVDYYTNISESKKRAREVAQLIAAAPALWNALTGLLASPDDPSVREAAVVALQKARVEATGDA